MRPSPRLLPLVLLMCLPGAAWAGGTAAVAPLVANGVDGKVSNNITSLISSELDFSGAYDTVNEIPAPSTLNSSCVTSTSCLGAIAKANKADAVVTGTVAPGGAGLKIALVLYDAKKNAIVRKKSYDIAADVATVAGTAPRMVKEITGQGAAVVEDDETATAAAAFEDEEDDFDMEGGDIKGKTRFTPDTKKGKLEDVSDDEEDEEADARAAAAAKAKAEAEAKARREAEAKAKAEAEERARKEAEAKAKARAEAEERARKEAEAKAKAEADAKARAKAEAEAKAAAEAKAKAKKAPPPDEDEEEEDLEDELANFSFGGGGKVADDGSAEEEEEGEEPTDRRSFSERYASSTKSSSKPSKTAARDEEEEEEEEEVEEEETPRASSRTSSRAKVEESEEEEEEETPRFSSRTKATDDEEEEEEEAPRFSSRTKPVAEEEDEEEESPRASSKSRASSEDDEEEEDTPRFSSRSSRTEDEEEEEDKPPKRRVSSEDDEDIDAPRRRDDDARARFGILARGGYARYGSLDFITYGVEMEIPVASRVVILMGVEGASTDRNYTDQERATIAAAAGIAPEQVQDWNAILPLDIGLVYKVPVTNIQPYIGADFLAVAYTATPDFAFGGRVRGGCDFMISDNFGFNVDLGVGVLAGEQFDLIQKDLADVGLYPEVSAGTVLSF